ncbi:MAG TPA: M20/M25/M40 family metallo-hydrolase [Thermoplasmata archaeon]
MAQGGPFSKVHAHIDAEFAHHVKRIQEYLRQPSVAITGEGIPECAEMTAARIREIGGEARVVTTRTHPLVLGRIKGAAEGGTLLRYDMYDVQPAEPLDAWKSPPWAAEIIGDRIVGRGAHNNKGPLAAYFNALQAILEVEGQLPCSIDFVIEGEEEIGSSALIEYVNGHREEFAHCDALDGWFPYQPTPTAPPPIECGFKGCLFFELVARGPNDVHSMMASIVDNPAWRLVWALETMRDVEDRVTVEGFYDDVPRPTPEERANLPKLRSYLEWPRVQAGVQRLRGQGKRAELDMLEELFFKPSPINLQGLTSGWQGEGCKTITPGEAVAKVDVRTVAKQDGNKLLAAIRRHLNMYGFGDVEIRAVDYTPWSRSPTDSAVVQAAARACRDFGWEPMVVPTDPGTGPNYLFTNNPPLHLHEFYGGLGHGGNIHAPNEYFLVESVRLFEKSAVNFLHRWAEMRRGPA